KGNAYKGNLRFAQLNTSVNNYIQAYVGYGAMDSIYGNLCADFRDFGYLYLAHNNANLSKVWVGGDMKLNSPTIGQLGYLYATTGQVNVAGNMDVNWRRVDVDITPTSPNKFQVAGKFNFDGNDTGDPAMNFQFFEVGTRGGSFLTGGASTNGISTSAGPGNLDIRNSIFKNETIKAFGVNEFSLFDNTFEGGLAHFQETTTGYSYSDGNKFTVDSTVFDGANTSGNIWSGSRNTSVTGGTKNTYKHLTFLSSNAGASNLNNGISMHGSDSIYGNLNVQFKNTDMFYFGYNAAGYTAKSNITGHFNYTHTGSTHNGGGNIRAQYGNGVRIEGNADFKMGTGRIEINQINNQKFIIDGTLNINTTTQTTSPGLDMYRVEVGTKGGTIKMNAVGTTNLYNNIFQNTEMFLSQMNTGTVQDNKILTDTIQFGYTGGSNYVNGNTFKGGTHMVMQNAGTIYVYSGNAANKGNNYQSHLRLRSSMTTGTQQFFLSHAAADTLGGNLTYWGDNYPSRWIYHHATNHFVFNGSADQQVNSLSTGLVHRWSGININKPSGKVFVNSPLIVDGNIHLNKGIVETKSTSKLNFFAGIVANGATDASYVDGPMNKALASGEVFTAPSGRGGFYAPAKISVGANTGNSFDIEYKRISPIKTFGSKFEDPIKIISNKELWQIDRTGGTAPASVQLSYNANRNGANYITDPSKISVMRHNGTFWANQGRIGNTTAPS
ncbi:MAG: hypothetical protein ACKOZZ_10305, partial [Bacteroidota bacterium]